VGRNSGRKASLSVSAIRKLTSTSPHSAYLLAGIPITRTDIFGTLTIVLGVVGVVAFGNHREETEFDKEQNLSLSLLKEIWARKEWVGYFTAYCITTAAFFWLSTIVHQVAMARVTDERGDAERTEADIDGMLEGGGGRRGNIEGSGFVANARRWKATFDKSHGQLRRRVRA
jgi:magnesium transporter